MAVRYGEFTELNTEILAIGLESVNSHKAWADTELIKMAGKPIPYPMISDMGGSISRLYGVFDEQKGSNLRATFIIDPNGYIQSAEAITGPIGRSSSEILRKLKAFQNYMSTGELMPCDWEPGRETLIQSLDLAGQVWKYWRPNQAGIKNRDD